MTGYRIYDSRHDEKKAFPHAANTSLGAQTSFSTVNRDVTEHLSDGLLRSWSVGGSGILGSGDMLTAQNPLCPASGRRTSDQLGEGCCSVLLDVLLGLSGGVMGSLGTVVELRNACSSLAPVTPGLFEYSDAMRDQKESRCESYSLRSRLWSMESFPRGFCTWENEEVSRRRFLDSLYSGGVTDRIGGRVVDICLGKIGT